MLIPAENEKSFKVMSLVEILEKEEVGQMWSRTLERWFLGLNSISDCAARMTKTKCMILYFYSLDDEFRVVINDFSVVE